MTGAELLGGGAAGLGHVGVVEPEERHDVRYDRDLPSGEQGGHEPEDVGRPSRLPERGEPLRSPRASDDGGRVVARPDRADEQVEIASVPQGEPFRMLVGEFPVARRDGTALHIDRTLGVAQIDEVGVFAEPGPEQGHLLRRPQVVVVEEAHDVRGARLEPAGLLLVRVGYGTGDVPIRALAALDRAVEVPYDDHLLHPAVQGRPYREGEELPPVVRGDDRGDPDRAHGRASVPAPRAAGAECLRFDSPGSATRSPSPRRMGLPEFESGSRAPKARRMDQ